MKAQTNYVTLLNYLSKLPAGSWSIGEFLTAINELPAVVATLGEKFTVRDIRYYQQAGLFEDAKREGRSLKYTNTHLLRILEVYKLRSTGVRQDVAISKIAKLTHQELLAQVVNIDPVVVAAEETEQPSQVIIQLDSVGLTIQTEAKLFVVTKDNIYSLDNAEVHLERNIITGESGNIPHKQPTFLEGELRVFPRNCTFATKRPDKLAVCIGENYCLIGPAEKTEKVWALFSLGSKEPISIENGRAIIGMDTGQEVLNQWKVNSWDSDDADFPCILSLVRKQDRFTLSFESIWGLNSHGLHTKQYPEELLTSFFDAYILGKEFVTTNEEESLWYRKFPGTQKSGDAIQSLEEFLNDKRCDCLRLGMVNDADRITKIVFVPVYLESVFGLSKVLTKHSKFAYTCKDIVLLNNSTIWLNNTGEQLSVTATLLKAFDLPMEPMSDAQLEGIFKNLVVPDLGTETLLGPLEPTEKTSSATEK